MAKSITKEYLEDFKKQFADDQLQKEYSYRELFQQIAASATQFTEDFSITVPKGKYFCYGRQSSDFKR